MLSLDDELINEFVKESREHLATIEADLLTIESMGDKFDEALVNKVFRAAHSIKGGSGFFGLDKVKELAHKTESVLDLLRSRKLAVNAEVVNLLLEAFDRLRGMVNNPVASQDEDIESLVQGLLALASSYLPAGQKTALESNKVLDGPPGLGSTTIPSLSWDRIKESGQNVYWIEGDLIHDLEQAGRNILSFFNQLTLLGEVLEFSLDYDAVGTLDGIIQNKLPLRLVIATTLTPAEIEGRLGIKFGLRLHLLHGAAITAEVAVAAAGPQMAMPQTAEPQTTVPQAAAAETPLPLTSPRAAAKPGATLSGAGSGTASGTGSTAISSVEDTLRVNVSLLDTLMNLAGELVLSRNQLRTAVAQQHQETLNTVNQRINHITSELQDVIMQTRLQPVDLVFSKFPRVTRDLSQSLGKELELEVVGKEVALDKTIIDGLSDPLTHMVRNAVDHGIETVEERRRAGKPAKGKIRIEARHEAGLVVLEIADDGKGIDGDKVARAAVKKGLITEEKVATLSEREKQALVFLPGLSTAEKVTEVSGRGVGMDVVKNNLSQLGGQVEIHSELGQGSLFRIKLPLTLAIIPALIVDAGMERFAIPQANVEELLRLKASEVKDRIELVGDSEVLLLRDRVLPLTRLSDCIGALPAYQDPASGRMEVDRRTRLADRRSRGFSFSEGLADQAEADSLAQSARPRNDRRKNRSSVLEIAVVTTGNLSYALVVDKFHDTEEIVVKPLGRRFKNLREYSGATILGDGTIALILDMAGLAAKAGLSSVEASARAREVAAAAVADRNQLTRSLLLFRNGPDEPCAIQLDLVQRIEKVRPEQIERLGSKRTMQYRGGSLPLVSLADVAKTAAIDGLDNLVVLVSTALGREVGLLGRLPIDIVEAQAGIDKGTHRQPGIAGSLILRDTTTLLVDISQIVEHVHPDWLEPAALARKAGAAAADTVAGSPQRSPQGDGSAGDGSAGDGSAWVVLAEDSDFFRNQIRQFLEESGFKVLAAADGEAAWQLIQQHYQSISVLVTDIEMPLLNGYELVRRVRGQSETRGLPVIAVTSLAGDEDAERGRAVGIDDYQIKLDRDKLVQSIRNAIAKTKEFAR